MDRAPGRTSWRSCSRRALGGVTVKRFLSKVLRATVPINIAFFGLILFALLVVLPGIPVEVFPNISFRQVQVSLRYPGASADEVERLVTRPVEDVIRGLEAIEYVASTSVPGRSEVVVKFADDADHKVGYDQFRLRVLSVLNSLPQVNGKILQPYFAELDVDSWVPVIQVMLVNSDDGNLDKRALTLLAKELRDRLERIPGVKRIDLAGDEFDQF
ncbi:MAG TPA: efflux RND transporter permease subunit, partial [Planctomycetes bacterium]|nr:efflux RND transporter permease subunit [Planctomycetota bacterium]